MEPSFSIIGEYYNYGKEIASIQIDLIAYDNGCLLRSKEKSINILLV
jgi:hypothetical protein